MSFARPKLLVAFGLVGTCLLSAGIILPNMRSLRTYADEAIARTVDDHYNHLTSLRARYTEHYAGLGLDRTESGTLLLKKPGRMRWVYDTPRGKLFLLDGQSAIFYTPGDTQAQRIPARQLDDLRSPLRFLLGHTELAKELDHLTLTVVSGGLMNWLSKGR